MIWFEAGGVPLARAEYNIYGIEIVILIYSSVVGPHREKSKHIMVRGCLGLPLRYPLHPYTSRHLEETYNQSGTLESTTNTLFTVHTQVWIHIFVENAPVPAPHDWPGCPVVEIVLDAHLACMGQCASSLISRIWHKHGLCSQQDIKKCAKNGNVHTRITPVHVRLFQK